MITDFRNKLTQEIWRRTITKGVAVEIQQMTLRKLRMLNNAKKVEDLRIPPSNNLEKLKGDRGGFYSIRVNRQWRICFRFEDGNASQVELVDYH